jgi:hypothetical protein
MPKRTPVVVYAREQWLDTPTLASDSSISLHVYRTPDHLLNEMLNDWYFSTIMHRLRAGDFIRIRDAENMHAEIIVDEIIKDRRQVLLSVYHVLNVMPVADAMAGDRCTVRWRGKRCFAIVRGGEILMQDIRSRDEAERALEYMRRSDDYTAQGVRSAKIIEERDRLNPPPRGRGAMPQPIPQFDAWEGTVKEMPAIRSKGEETDDTETEAAAATGAGTN